MRGYSVGDTKQTVILRPSNHDTLAKIINKLDDGGRDRLIKLLKRSDIDADDILERISGNEKVLSAVQKHADEFLECAEKYKTDFVKVLSTYPDYADDIIRLTGLYGDDIIRLTTSYGDEFITVLSKYPDYADDIIKLTDEFGNDFVTVLSTTADDAVGKHINLSLLDLYSRNSFDNNISKVCVAYDRNEPIKRGFSVNGTYFKNKHLLEIGEVNAGGNSILDDLYNSKYGTNPIDDYTDYFVLSMTDEYLDSLPNSYFTDKGLNRQSVKSQMKKLSEAIENTKEMAIAEGRYTEWGSPSFEKRWKVENCAEIWSIRQAIMNGAEWDNISFKCIDKRMGKYVAPCENCQNTFKELFDLGGES